MEWIAIFFALGLGVFAGWKISSRSAASLGGRIASLEAELAVKNATAEQEKNMLLQSAAAELAHQKDGYEKLLASEKENNSRMLAEQERTLALKLDLLRKEKELLTDNAAREIALLREAHAKAIAAEQENTKLRMAEQEKALAAKMDLIKSEFKTLSENLYNEKSDLLKKENNLQLENLLKPLREKMTEFKQSVDSSREKGIEQSAQLAVQIQKMMDEAKRLGSEAGSLAAALKGEQKTQGNWGEMILEDILSRSGLQKNVHYECQETIRDDDGSVVKTEENKMLRPDVIVHYPDGKDVIIDSKVSLTAYTEYMNSEDDAARENALVRHCKSVKNHVDELAKKNYTGYLKKRNRETAGFVIMFIPNESSYLLAMRQDPGLWRSAFERRVLIVSPMNLIALLQLIHTAWVKADQDRNQEEILKTAGQLLDRLYAFYEDFDEIGQRLGKVQDSYSNALNRLKHSSGGHSIVHSGERLKKLGVKLAKVKNLPGRLEINTDELPSLPGISVDESSAKETES